MSGSFIFLPPSGGGSSYVEAPVATAASLPVSSTIGALCLVLDTGTVYYYNGVSWDETDQEVSPGAVSDTNSIDLSVSSGAISADLRLSTTGPAGNNTAIALDVLGGGSPGLRAQLSATAYPQLSGVSLVGSDSSIRQAVSIKNTDELNNNNGSFVSFKTNNDSSVEVETSRFVVEEISHSAGAEDTVVYLSNMQAGILTESFRITQEGRVGVNNSSPSAMLHVNNKAAAAPALIAQLAPAQSANAFEVRNSSSTVLASIDETGLIEGSAYKGVATGSAAAAGNIGEIITAEVAAATGTGVGATGTWGSVTSISLTAGAWDIDGVVGFTENAATLTTSLSCGISTSASGSGIDQFNTTQLPVLISGAADLVSSTPRVSLVVSGSTTVHLNTRFYYTAGSPQHRGRIRAIRRAQ